MKKYILLATLIFTFSCNKQVRKNSDIEYVSNSELMKIYGNVGTWHNKALDFVYGGLKSGKINSPYTYIYGMNEFLKSEGFDKQMRQESHVSLPEDFDFYATYIIKEYTTDLKEYLDNPYMLRDKYLLRPRLTLTERKQIIGMASVAKASSEYWATNSAKWVALANRNPSIQEGGKDIVLDDTKGAGIGAVSGAIKGAMGGTVAIPGIGTVTGAACGGLAGMVVGAVSASVSSAVWKAFKNWIGWYSVEGRSAWLCRDGYGRILNGVCVASRQDSLQWFEDHLDRDSIPFTIDSLNLLP